MTDLMTDMIVKGNHHEDAWLLAKLTDRVCDPSLPMSVRVSALVAYDSVMGVEEDHVSEEDVLEFVAMNEK